MMQLLAQRFLRQAREHPERPAVISGQQVLTYGELALAAIRVGHGLIRRGVHRESVVGICIRPSPDTVAALLGVWLAGGCYLPLNPMDPEQRVRRVITLAKAGMVLTDRRRPTSLLGLPGDVDVIDLGELAGDGLPTSPPAQAPVARQAAYMIFTSGTSGDPKGVVIEHEGIANRVLWAVRMLELSATDRILHKTPLTFDAAQWEIFAPLVCGAPVTLADAEAGGDATALVEAIRERKATVVQVVPSMLRLLAAEPGLASCRSLRMICAGGEPLQAELCQQVLRQLDVEIWNTYGPTECTIDVTAARFDWSQHSGPVAIGEPIDNNRCQLIAPNGEPVAPGVIAELYASGVGVGRGYAGNPSLTAEKFLPDAAGPPGARMYRTGDLGRRRPDGVLEYIGRVDAQLKVNGVRIEPGEVEAALLSHPQVVDAAVRAAVDPHGIGRLIAYLVTVSGRSVDDLPAYLRDRLPASMVPTLFTELDALPRTTTGKTDRSRLPEPDWESMQPRSAPVEPETTEQRLVLKVWQELLGFDEIGLEDDFFRVGGHSLMMTSLASRLTEASGLELDLPQLYQSTTVRTQAQLLEHAMRAQPIPRLPDDARLPLSHAQERFWLLDRMNPGSAEYLLPIVIRLPAKAGADTIEQALTHLAARHDVLRMRYLIDGGGPYVRIDPPATVKLRTVDTVRDSVGKVLAEELATGFDLSAGPPWRPVLLRYGGSEQLLSMVCHHIISDGQSAAVLERETRELVAALTESRAPQLPEVPLRYVDIAAWQRAQLTDELRAQQGEYWRQALAGMPALDLPTMRPRDATRRLDGSAVAFDLPADVATPLVQVGRQGGASPFMTLLTLWTTLLAHSSGQWDFGVGTPYAGRSRPETHNLVGPLLNTVVLRSPLAPELSFADALTAVQRTCRSAFANHAVPFETVVETVSPHRDLSRTPLYQVLFTLVDGLLGASPSDDDVDLLQHVQSVARTDLTIMMWRHDGGRFGCLLVYAAALYSRAAIEEMARQLTRLAEVCAADPDLPLGAIDLATGSSGAEPNDPVPPHQEVILELFRELLARERIEADESFFDLGGNSLRAARLLWSVQSTFGVEVPMRVIFDHPTAAGLARVVEELVRAEIDESRESGGDPREEEFR